MAKRTQDIKREPEEECFLVVLPAQQEIKQKLVKLEVLDNSKATKLKCQKCGKNFKEKTSLEKHNCNKICEFCGKSFVMKSSMLSHILTSHPAGGQNFLICDCCGKIFTQKYLLQDHMKTHLTRRKCPKCDKMFTEKRLKIHLKTVHNRKESKCEVCGKVLKSDTQLQVHRRVHNKKLECGVCGQKFGRRFHLERHQVKHEKGREKIFECKLCGVKCPSMGQLTKHKNVHKNEKNSSHNLKSRPNSDENHLKCQKCPVMLKDKQAVRHHMVNVHPTARFECDKCGRAINAKTNLRKHINYHLKLIAEDNLRNL